MLLKTRCYCLGLLLVAAPALAGGGEAGTGSLEFGLGYYHNDDGSTDGNPFLDEELTVIEPVVIFDYNLSEETAVYGKFSYDYVSSASIDRLSNFPAQSGASGDYYFGLDLGVRRSTSETETWGLNSHLSVEYDYFSFGLGADYAHELPDRQASYKLSLNGFYDSIDVIRFNGEEEGSDTRLTLSSTFNWYQIINPLTHAEYGASLSLQNGFLETAYNAVVIEDTATPNPNLVNSAPGREIAEELDDTRARLALFGKVRHSLSTTHAVELGGRIYSDTWGINSLALEPRWTTWVVPEKLEFRLRYRWYMQTEADAYQERFVTVEGERTQDSDLADFNAQTIGGLFTWHLSDDQAIDVGADYVLRSDDLNQVLGRVAYRRPF